MTTARWRGARRAVGVLAAALLLVVAQACDREKTPAYGGDPEGRIVTAGQTADELVTNGATAREIAEVELSAGLVERWFAAQERLDALGVSDPGVWALLDGRGGGGGRDGDVIPDAARRLEGDARVRAAIEESGLSAREFVLTALALHQALLASGPGAPPELRRLAARNVRFVDRNAALLEQLAMPRPRRTLAYADTAQYDGAFVDTLTSYDDAPYDSYRYPDTASDDDSLPPLPVDTPYVVDPPVPDTLLPPPPPVVAPPVPSVPPLAPPPSPAGEEHGPG